MKNSKEIETAIAHAVHHAIAVLGIEGLRKTSMFPSSEKNKN